MTFKFIQVILKPVVSIIICCLFTSSLFAQHDSLILKNGDVIVGEIKSLSKGVITIETDYSKNDFTIEWSGIKKIYSKSHFLITLKDGTRINGSFQSIDTSKKINIDGTNGETMTASLEEIVYLKGIKSQFWSRLYGNIDLGLSLSKANNLSQFSTRSALGYLADKWQLAGYYNDTRSKQDSIADTKRTESGISFTYFLPNDWYIFTSINTLANTEQALKLRFSGKLGGGKFFVHTNKATFGAGGGLQYNGETFTNNTEKRSSLEGFAGFQANLFDIGDFSLLTDIYIYKSFTESGRWRSDFKLDSKYKLPHDFYIKLSGTVNYDNRPAIIGNEVDFVTSFSVGWELNK